MDHAETNFPEPDRPDVGIAQIGKLYTRPRLGNRSIIGQQYELLFSTVENNEIVLFLATTRDNLQVDMLPPHANARRVLTTRIAARRSKASSTH